MLWQADRGDGTYRNPILFSDYSDPDVVRHGDTYYMTASSFNYTPGLPILTSKDLVNWELKNYAAQNLPDERFNLPQHAQGVWAPSIRFHNGKFYITVGMPDEGIYVTSTEDPLGQWSPLSPVWKGKGFIDPCPLWDDDGKAYIVHAYAKSRIGFKSRLGIMEADPETLQCISDDIYIFDGTETQPTIEGPKIFKRNGLYYILAPAGGVKTGWQTALRSKNIFGPYEEKIVMKQGLSPVNGPHQGGLTDTESGEEWFIHFQYKNVYGRIVHLQPVKWSSGWPIIGRGVITGEPVECCRKPDTGRQMSFCEPPSSDNFENSELGLQWQWTANHFPHFYSLTERAGSLCLYPLYTAKTMEPVLWECSNILTQKLMCPAFTAETVIDASELPEGCRTGVIWLGGQYVSIGIERKKGTFELFYVESCADAADSEKRRERAVAVFPLKNASFVKIRMKVEDGGSCTLSAKTEGGTWITPAPPYRGDGGYWVGAKIGIYAVSSSPQTEQGRVFFDYFTVAADVKS